MIANLGVTRKILLAIQSIVRVPCVSTKNGDEVSHFIKILNQALIYVHERK